MTSKNNPPQNATPPTPVAPPTEADKIWNEIKDRPMEMFALPGQTIEKFCKPVKADPTRLFLVLNFSSVLPSLEETLSNKKLGNTFTCELADKFVIVSRAAPSYDHLVSKNNKK